MNSSFSMRNLKARDIDLVTQLLASCLDLDQLTPSLISEKLWEDPDFDPALNQVLLHRGRMVGLISGVIRPTQSRGFVKILAIEESYRLQGLASRLLQDLESKIFGRGIKTIRVGESAPNYLWPGVDLRYTRAMLFFEFHGYQTLGQTSNMELDLTGNDWELAEAPPGFELRRATAADIPDLTTFLQATWPSWQPEIRQCFRYEAPSLHLALRGQSMVGFSGFDANNRGTGWFGPIGVLEAHRAHGLGQALLYRCLKDLRAQGLEKATIPWVGPLYFYTRCAGARISRSFNRYEKAAWP